MTVKLLAAAAIMAVGLGLATSASAAPASPVGMAVTDGLITQVAQGCGPGFFRGPAGYCRPMGGRFYGPRPYEPRRFYGPRPFYGPHCFVRHTPWGPRRFCR